jgi:hypothetical protein
MEPAAAAWVRPTPSPCLALAVEAHEDDCPLRNPIPDTSIPEVVVARFTVPVARNATTPPLEPSQSTAMIFLPSGTVRLPYSGMKMT